MNIKSFYHPFPVSTIQIPHQFRGRHCLSYDLLSLSGSENSCPVILEILQYIYHPYRWCVGSRLRTRIMWCRSVLQPTDMKTTIWSDEVSFFQCKFFHVSSAPWITVCTLSPRNTERFTSSRRLDVMSPEDYIISFWQLRFEAVIGTGL